MAKKAFLYAIFLEICLLEICNESASDLSRLYCIDGGYHGNQDSEVKSLSQ